MTHAWKKRSNVPVSFCKAVWTKLFAPITSLMNRGRNEPEPGGYTRAFPLFAIFTQADVG